MAPTPLGRAKAKNEKKSEVNCLALVKAGISRATFFFCFFFFPCLLRRFIQKKRKTPQHVWGCCSRETMGFCKRRDLVDLPNLRYDLFASKNKHAVVVLTLWFLEMGPGPNTSHLTDVSPPLKQGVSAGEKHWVTNRSRTFFGCLL